MIIGRTLLLSYIDEPNESKRAIYIDVIDEGAGEFSKDDQIGRDSIDLRIGRIGYKLKKDCGCINTLAVDLEKCFEDVVLDQNGYKLMPSETLIVGTVERIKLVGSLMGQVTGRTRYARLGLSVHCTSTKFQGNSNATIILQLTNHNKVPLIIFPYQKLAQLIVHEVSGYPNEALGGNFDNEKTPLKPKFVEKEFSQYSCDMMEHIKRVNFPYRPFLSLHYRRQLTALSRLFSCITTFFCAILGVIIAVASDPIRDTLMWISLTIILFSTIVSFTFSYLEDRQGED